MAHDEEEGGGRGGGLGSATLSDLTISANCRKGHRLLYSGLSQNLYCSDENQPSFTSHISSVFPLIVELLRAMVL